MFLAQLGRWTGNTRLSVYNLALLVSEGLAAVHLFVWIYMYSNCTCHVYRVWIYWHKMVEQIVSQHIPTTAFCTGPLMELWRLQLRWHHSAQNRKKKIILEDYNCRVNGRVDQSAVLRVAARYARYVPKYECHYPFPCGAYRRSNYDHNGEIIFFFYSPEYLAILRTG